MKSKALEVRVLNPIRDGKKTSLVLSIAAISLFMLSAPLSFAESNGNDSPVIPTEAKTAAGAASGFASYLSFKASGIVHNHASDISASDRAFVNELRTGAQEPYTQELQQLQTHEASSTEAMKCPLI
jgi:hypothetical protein